MSISFTAVQSPVNADPKTLIRQWGHIDRAAACILVRALSRALISGYVGYRNAYKSNSSLCIRINGSGSRSVRGRTQIAVNACSGVGAILSGM